MFCFVFTLCPVHFKIIFKYQVLFFCILVDIQCITLCSPLQRWQTSRRPDSPLSGLSQKRSTRPDRVWSAGLWTQRRDGPGEPAHSARLKSITVEWALSVQIHKVNKLFVSISLSKAEYLLYWTTVFSWCTLIRRWTLACYCLRVFFQVGERRRRDHRGDCQPRKT